MPTNYRTQVKVAEKPQMSLLARDGRTGTPSVGKDPVSPSVKQIAQRSAAIYRDGASLDSEKVVTLTRVPKKRARSAAYAVAKRAFDLVVGLILLSIAMPVVLIAALAIRIDTPGSPFFFQTRLGKDGKPFRIFKLRGMYRDARARFPAYYDYSHKRDLEFCFHHEEDPRVTRAGMLIRKTSIDELPNLWNVVTGDMSLVGPRPEIPDVLALYGPYQREYLSVKPGVTCLSKITGRDRLTKRETIEFDLRYIRERSFGVDLKILWKTFCSVVLRRDVF